MEPIDGVIQHASLGAVLAQLVEAAPRTLGISPETARAASCATERGLRGQMRAPSLSRADVRRVQAYYSAVVRSRAFKDGRRGDERYRRRIRVASLVTDLRSVGTPDERIRDEVRLFFGEDALRYLGVGAVA